MKYLLLPFLLFIFSPAVYAATVNLGVSDSPSGTKIVHVSLDTDGDTVNAVSGTLSFPADMYQIKVLDTANSIVSLWAVSPALNKERNFNLRSQVVFEGIMPGGFSGVRSPYYTGERSGKLFDIELIPVSSGEAVLLFDDMQVLAHDGKGTKLPVNTNELSLQVKKPQSIFSERKDMTRVTTGDLHPFTMRTPDVADGKWFLVNEFSSHQKALKELLVAETTEYNPERVRPYDWRSIVGTYVLLYQHRDKFVHVKAVYYDNTYEVATLQPVENLQSNSLGSYILVSIIMLLLGNIVRTYYVTRTARTKHHR